MCSPAVLTVGIVFCDQIFTHLPQMPVLGEEIFGNHSGLMIGGGSAITAVGLSRLGISTGCVARVGRDYFGTFLRNSLREEGVDTEGLVEDEEGGTNLTVALSYPEDRAYISALGRAEEAELDTLMKLCYDYMAQKWRNVRHVHLCGHKVNPSFPKKLQEKGITVSLDIGWDPEGVWEGLADVLRYTDVFLPNLKEATRITGTAAVESALEELARFVPTVVIKLGDQGSAAIHKGKIFNVPAFPVTPVDTTGAGEAFNAGFLYGWVKGRPKEECLAIGNICGAKTVERPGGTKGLPYLEEVEEAYENRCTWRGWGKNAAVY